MSRRRTAKLAFLVPAAALCLAMTGCATTKKIASSVGLYDSLGSGKSDVAYATELPVGSAAEAVALGDSAYREGDLDKALFNYIRALEKDGDNSAVLYKIGAIHDSRGNTQLAEAAYRWALKGNPQHARSLEGLGILLMKRRDHEQARTSLQAAIRADSRLPRAHNALGVLADMERDYTGAQRHYEESLAIANGSPEVWNNLGYSRYLSGNHKGAIAAYQEALKVNPAYERAWRNLGLVYARDKQYDKAIDALSKVQDVPKAYNDVGYVAMVNGQLKEAEVFFDEAMEMSPSYYELAGMNAQRLQMMKGSGTVSRN